MLVFIISTACSSTTDSTETQTNNDEQIATLERTIESQSEALTNLEAELVKTAEELSQVIEKLKSLENQQQQSISGNLLSTSLDVLEALDTKDMVALANLSHPLTPVRFTPYAYVNPSTDLSFAASAFQALISDTTIYTWGEYDGSGDPLNLTFDAYWHQ
jgi:uncharacterized coiled-coil protein SlyX